MINTRKPLRPESERITLLILEVLYLIIHGYMLDESEDDANVFTLSIGNVPSKCDVIIKIVYPLESFIYYEIDQI